VCKKKIKPGARVYCRVTKYYFTVVKHIKRKGLCEVYGAQFISCQQLAITREELKVIALDNRIEKILLG
jgi:hypothetical protein